MRKKNINSKIKTIIFVFFIILFCCNIKRSFSNGCSFDLQAIDKKFFIKNTNFDDAEWDNKNKEAKIILTKNETISIKYSGCNHFGMEANYKIQQYNRLNPVAFVEKKIIWFGKKLLNDSDYKLLLEAIKDVEFQKSLKDIEKTKEAFKFIPCDQYNEFIITINYIKPDTIVINISWYMG